MLLYHGSAYLQDELKPGYAHTRRVERWDKTETNRWLYASSERATAIEVGFASTVAKRYQLDRYSTKGDSIILQLSDRPLPKVRDLYRLPLYLYTIDMLAEDDWEKNANEHNQLTTEYKTKSTIYKGIKRREPVNVADFLKGRTVVITSEPAYKDW